MDLTFAHYRNRFCMFRTYYALASGKVKPDGFNLKVIELPDPPSHEQEEALIRGEVQVANIYMPSLLRRSSCSMCSGAARWTRWSCSTISFFVARRQTAFAACTRMARPGRNFTVSTNS